jgi:hypothetical protein
MSNCNINNDGAKAIANLISSNNTLTHINLETNDIGGEGILAIIEALKGNTSVIELKLTNQVSCSLSLSLPSFFLSLQKSHIGLPFFSFFHHSQHSSSQFQATSVPFVSSFLSTKVLSLTLPSRAFSWPSLGKQPDHPKDRLELARAKLQKCLGQDHVPQQGNR